MTVRIYIIAAESRDPLEPTFNGVVGKLFGAFEVLDFDDFMKLGNVEIRHLAGELATMIGKPSLIDPAFTDPIPPGPVDSQ